MKISHSSADELTPLFRQNMIFHGEYNAATRGDEASSSLFFGEDMVKSFMAK